VYSQKTILNEKGDTTICFSVGQSKYLLKKVYEVDKWKSLDSICEKQIVVSDSIKASLQRSIKTQSTIIKNQDDIIVLKGYEIQKLTDSLADKNKAIRRQKTYKWVAIISGGALSGFLGYKYITK
jgi:hypothetical protein